MRGRYTDSNTVRQKNKYVRLLVTVGSILLAAGILFMIAKFSYNHFFKKYNSSINVDSLYKFWEAKDYKKVYDISNEIIAKDFLNNAARTLHGYSSFMLAAAQTESQSNQDLLDEAIINIRIALQYAKENMVPQLEYMLGKAYFYKDGMKNSADAEDGGEHESHYYADLAIKYLTMSREAGFTADDLSNTWDSATRRSVKRSTASQPFHRCLTLQGNPTSFSWQSQSSTATQRKRHRQSSTSRGQRTRLRMTKST